MSAVHVGSQRLVGSQSAHEIHSDVWHFNLPSNVTGKRFDSPSTKLTAADGAAEDYFGGAVGLDGNTIVVGAYYGDDAVALVNGQIGEKSSDLRRAHFLGMAFVVKEDLAIALRFGLWYTRLRSALPNRRLSRHPCAALRGAA